MGYISEASHKIFKCSMIISKFELLFHLANTNIVGFHALTYSVVGLDFIILYFMTRNIAFLPSLFELLRLVLIILGQKIC